MPIRLKKEKKLRKKNATLDFDPRFIPYAHFFILKYRILTQGAPRGLLQGHRPPLRRLRPALVRGLLRASPIGVVRADRGRAGVRGQAGVEERAQVFKSHITLNVIFIGETHAFLNRCPGRIQWKNLKLFDRRQDKKYPTKLDLKKHLNFVGK